MREEDAKEMVLALIGLLRAWGSGKDVENVDNDNYKRLSAHYVENLLLWASTRGK